MRGKAESGERGHCKGGKESRESERERGNWEALQRRNKDEKDWKRERRMETWSVSKKRVRGQRRGQ